ncbi:hypothetical protein M5689_019540 [Euphorbia peplus]|nr:hypothetical protein M5689_019540 [Euphorbia peplus]
MSKSPSNSVTVNSERQHSHELFTNIDRMFEGGAQSSGRVDQEVTVAIALGPSYQVPMASMVYVDGLALEPIKWTMERFRKVGSWIIQETIDELREVYR